MGLSLAQSTRKNRVGEDPRNTQWANDTNRFGHKQMLNMGWVPGKGLGYSVEGTKEHVKVQYKVDSKGLGYELEKADQPTGLDVFQKILGKLNGNSEEVEEKQQHRARMTGLYMHFVPGGVLEGTVKSKEEMKQLKKVAENKEKQLEEEKEKEKEKEKALEKEKERTKKSDKKHDPKRKSKDVEKHKSKAKKSAEKAAKKAAKKLEKAKKSAKDDAKSSSEADKQPQPARQARGIRATRNRYIAMKRQATLDSKSLKEILMQ